MNKTIQKPEKNTGEMEKQDRIDSKKKPSFLKRMWDNYLRRLNKTTNGKPQCCK